MTVHSALALDEFQDLRRLSGILSLPKHARPQPYTVPTSQVRVPGLSRDVWVKMASTRAEWEDALRLVTDTYRSRGYENCGPGQLRFTPYHALPDTNVFVAKHGERVLMTMTLVSDNTLLGLPMEVLYGDEINQLRADGRYMVEATSLADQGLQLQEFIPVFTTLMRVMAQFGIYCGANTWVIAINPRHRRYYAKVMGFVAFGPQRNYPYVQNHPAEAYMLDPLLLKTNAPDMYRHIFGEWLPPEELRPRSMPPELILEFAECSSQTTPDEARRIIEWVEAFGSPRRW